MIQYFKGLNENMNLKSFKIEIPMIKNDSLITYEIKTTEIVNDITSGDNYMIKKDFTVYKTTFIEYDLIEIFNLDKKEALKLHNEILQAIKDYNRDYRDIYEFDDLIDIKEI